jgi:phospholipase/carboxylesterase
MNAELLECVECEPEGPARSSVIWLHGLGADGHDFEPVIPELALSDDLAVRFVFPHAPQRPVTINGGMVMRAWYDILDLDNRRDEDEEGLRTSEAQVRALVEREVSRGVSEERIVLAGFSQGGAIALQAGVRHPRRLAGIMALSTYLTLPEKLESEASPANRDCPVFMAHGIQDPVIPFEGGRLSKDALVAQGYAVDWREYPMPHSVCAEEIADISAWLAGVLS